MKQGQFLSNGMYIPPADAWKMLQWLQQNSIPIPGVSYPTTDANAGALTTLPPNGAALNQFAFPNALADMNGTLFNFHSTQPVQAEQMGGNMTSPWPTTTYGASSISNQPQQPNEIGGLYQNHNQFLTSLLPLTSLANERPPDMNIAQVANNSDKLGQLSTHVEAMEQGIDSLIQGMGLDPISAASLCAQQGVNPNANDPYNMGSHTLDQQQGIPPVVNGPNGISQDGFAMQMDPYQSTSSDFDLDELLKHIGVAAAANTPPALHAPSDGFPELNVNVDQPGLDSQLNDPFDPSMFHDVNLGMYASNPDPAPFFGMADDRQPPNQPPSHPLASGFLNEVASPMTTRDGSAEPAKDAFDASKETPAGRGRTKKRKQDDARRDSISQDAGAAAPNRTQSKGTARASKRRK